MIFEAGMSWCSILFMILLIMIYYSKNSFNTLNSKMYKIMMILSLLFSVSEVVNLLLIKYINVPILLERILFRTHWAFAIFFFLFNYLYFYIIIFNKKEMSFKELVKIPVNLILSIIFTLLAFVHYFLNYYQKDFNNLELINKSTFVASLTIICSTLIIILYQSVKNPGNLKKKEKTYIFAFAIISTIGLFFQFVCSNISLMPFFITLSVYILYFTSEDPDIYVVDEISSAQGDIEKSNQTKTDFLSNMTYEIKTPMNVIVSLCDELVNMGTYDQNEVRESIKQIKDSGNSLLDIVNNILDISKIETGKETLSEKEYKINDILSNILNITNQKIGSKPVKFLVNIDQSTSSVLYGDSSKLYQSLLNICTNAVKYTEVGRITFTLSSSKTNGVEHLLFKVSDTGTGIKDEDKEKLFSKGSRLENANAGEVEGSGYGLVITKQYIESLGGKIWFESQYRVGTTFYIEVPQKIIDSTPLGALAKEVTSNANEKLDCSNYKALIVDDNLLNIKVAKRLLEGYKFQVESVTSGKECVDKIKEEMKYDIIFMDHMMPEMDGIETLHVLKKLEGYTLPPIVALTANAIAGMKEMYLNEGFDDYLSKPINTHELDRVINKFLKK